MDTHCNRSYLVRRYKAVFREEKARETSESALKVSRGADTHDVDSVSFDDAGARVRGDKKNRF